MLPAADGAFATICCLQDAGGANCFEVESAARCRELSLSSFTSRRLSAAGPLAAPLDSSNVPAASSLVPPPRLENDIVRSMAYLANPSTSLMGWEDVAVEFVAYPLVAALLVLSLWYPLGLFHHRCLSGRKAQKFLTNHIGGFNRLPQSGGFIKAMECVQIACSLLSVILFMNTCYEQKKTRTVIVLNQCSGFFFSLHFLLRGLQTDFRCRSLLNAGSFVDLLTIPGLMRFSGCWLSLAYLRSIEAVVAYTRLERLSRLHLSLGPVLSEIILMCLRLTALVVCFASAIFTLEVLGDPPWMSESDRSVETSMGKITIFTIIYWIVETLTTVGYGDYHPGTTFSKLATMICMGAGIVFLTIEVTKIQAIAAQMKEGTGEFVMGSSAHVVLLGGGVVKFDQILLGGFLDELYNKVNRRSWPDLVIMGSGNEEIKALQLSIENHFRHVPAMESPLQRITYLVGSPLQKQDLARCRCDKARMVYIVPNSSTKTEEDEDKHNILRTISVKRHFPKTGYRLIVLQVSALEQAISAGIEHERVFSINEFRGALLWESGRNPGWSTMVNNMLTTSSPVLAQLDHLDHTAWQAKYLQGRATQIHGLLAAEKFVGKPVNEFIFEAFRQNGILLIAQLVEHTQLLPLQDHDAVVLKDTVFWAMATSRERLEGIERGKLHDWQEVLRKKRLMTFSNKASAESVQKRLAKMTAAMPGKSSKSSLSSLTLGEDAPPEVNSMSSTYPNHVIQDDVIQESQDILSKAAVTFTDSHDHEDNGTISHNNQSIQSDFSHHKFHLDSRRESRHMAHMLSGTQSFCGGEMSLRLGHIRGNVGAQPFILLLVFSTSWMEVYVFLRRSRERKKKVGRWPIVVLCKTTPGPEETDLWYLLSQYKDISIMQGNPKVEKDLLKAGVLQCTSIICMGSSSKTSDEAEEEFLDSDILLTYRLLQRLHLHHKKRILLEFKNAEHLRLMPHHDSNPGDTDHEDDQNALDPALRGEGEYDGSYTVDRRFAAGDIFLPRVLGTLLGCSFRTRGIIEVMQALTIPETMEVNQPNRPWQIAVPEEFWGKEYSELLERLLSEELPALPLGLARLIHDAPRAISELDKQHSSLIDPMGSDSGSSEDDKMAPGLTEQETADLVAPLTASRNFCMDGIDRTSGLRSMAIGLETTRTPSHSFVFTNPPSTEVLEEEDIIFVLGSEKFAQKCVREGLLKCCGSCHPEIDQLGQ